MNLFSRLKFGLSRTRSRIESIVGTDDAVVDDEFYENLEEALVSADIGIELSVETIDIVKGIAEIENVKTVSGVFDILKRTIINGLSVTKLTEDFPPKPWVTLVVGVNGVGKTTTIGKLASELKQQGKNVMLGAADTFRAGAIEQLKIWAERTGSDIISQQEGSDPASVAFDAMDAAKARGTDVLILDTAGRLHNKTNLMTELEKIVRVVKKHTPHAPNDILLVVDATTGQNALKQAEAFHKSLGLTGLVITKLDGTAKGGMAFALARKLKVPIRKIGVGEGIDDLQTFNPQTYADAMFGDFNKS